MTRSILAFTLVLGLVACKLDNKDPVVDLFQVNGQEDRLELAAGGTLQFNAALSDNKGLMQARIRLTRPTFLPSSSDSVSLSWQTVYGLSGNQEEILDSLSTTSDTRSGPYQVTLSVVDENGNELSSPVVRDVELTKTTISAQILSPDFSLGPVTVSPLDTITLSVSLSSSLAPIGNVYLRLVALEEGEPNQYSNIWAVKDSLYTSWDLDGPVKVPVSEAASGSYELQLVVGDTLYDYSSDYGRVEVVP